MAMTPKTDLARALVPFLEPFHEVDGQALKAVWETATYGDTEALELEFESCFLTLEIDPDDDTIDIALHQARKTDSVPVSDLEPWTNLIGKQFGWGWIGINQQGYMDGVSFSFGAVTPQFCVTAIASRLSLSRIEGITLHKSKRLEPAA